MATRTWGGSVNSTAMFNGDEDYVYSFGAPGMTLPTCPLTAAGTRPLLLGSIWASDVTNAEFYLNWASTNYGPGAIVPGDGREFNFMAYRTGGTSIIGRNTASGGATRFQSGYNGNYPGVMPGGFSYTTAPTAPALSSLTPMGPSAARLVWAAPTDDGDSDITGYRIQWSLSPTFTSPTTINVGPTPRSHDLVDLPAGVKIYVRVAALNAVTTAASTSSQYSNTLDVLLIAEVGDLDGWTAYGPLPGGLTPLIGDGVRRGPVYAVAGNPSGLIREIEHTGSGSVPAGTLGLQRTFTGLTIGNQYRLDGLAIALGSPLPKARAYRFEVVGLTNGSTVTVTTNPQAIPALTFTATATSHTVRIAQRSAASWSGSGWFERVALYGLSLTYLPLAPPERLQDTVYEGPLATHFTYACDTVGASWWVGKDGITRFRQLLDAPAPRATFTDQRAGGELEYIDITAGYDTRNVLNILEVINHGRDPLTGLADDVTYAAADGPSVAAHGPRPGRVDMTMHDSPAGTLDARINDILDARGTPARQVTGLTWNAREDLDLAGRLELQDRVRVRFRGQTSTLRVIGLRHELTPRRWLIHLTLAP